LSAETEIGGLAPDPALVRIADYICTYEVTSTLAIETAAHCLVDSLACGLEALNFTDCTKLLGPEVAGSIVPNGARVPGTSFQLEPATAAFDLSCMLRWLDFSDTFIATQTCHPSDDIGAILAVADHLSRVRAASGKPPFTVKQVLELMVKAHEVQGVLGMQNALGAHGIDHSLLVRIACSGVVARLMGGSRSEVVNAISLAFFEPSLCIHRFGSNTGPRKGWASADSASQAVRFATMAVKGEPGYPNVLTHPKWGFEKTFMGGTAFVADLPFGSQVMEGVLFKIAGPVVIHAQSAIECALRLHGKVDGRLNDIERIEIESHARTLSAIDKKGPLRNAADRDHCLQYAVAVALLHGRLTASDYEDGVAADPRIDRLRELMHVRENAEYTKAFTDPQRRQNPNSMQVYFRDGTCTEHVKVEQPLGHPARRAEGIPLLIEKFRRSVNSRFAPAQAERIFGICLDRERLMKMPVHEFTDAFAV
jgi:2-methylcitrate dehydratase